MAATRFGQLLRELRSERQMGIKQLGPELGVTYTYISKLENERAKPSEELIQRIATFFNCNPDMLYIAADKVPADAIDVIRRQPNVTLPYLRRLGKRAGRRR